MSDNGSQPTSQRFIREVVELGIRQAVTSYNNPKGNAYMKRGVQMPKKELIRLRKWLTVEEVAEAIRKYAKYFNENYLHSALNYKTPNQFENNIV